MEARTASMIAAETAEVPIAAMEPVVAEARTAEATMIAGVVAVEAAAPTEAMEEVVAIRNEVATRIAGMTTVAVRGAMVFPPLMDTTIVGVVAATKIAEAGTVGEEEGDKVMEARTAVAMMIVAEAALVATIVDIAMAAAVAVEATRIEVEAAAIRIEVVTPRSGEMIVLRRVGTMTGARRVASMTEGAALTPRPVIVAVLIEGLRTVAVLPIEGLLTVDMTIAAAGERIEAPRIAGTATAQAVVGATVMAGIGMEVLTVPATVTAMVAAVIAMVALLVAVATEMAALVVGW